MQSQLYILIINYNGMQATTGCIRSLMEEVDLGFKVLLIDNGSNDGSWNEFEKRYSSEEKIILLRNDANQGFACGSNTGIRLAMEYGAEYILLLNNDTIVRKGCVQKLMHAMESDKRIGIAGPKILQMDESRYLDSAGAWGIKALAQPFLRGHGDYDQGQYSRIESVGYVSGTAMMVRSSVFAEVGLLDDIFFMYFEDWDFNCRVQATGHKTVYVPDAVIYHQGSGTTKKDSAFYNYYHARNRILFARKHQNWLIFLVCFLPYFILYRFLWKGLLFLCHGDRASFKALVKGVLWNIQHPTCDEGRS